jgi:hypothetical protein
LSRDPRPIDNARDRVYGQGPEDVLWRAAYPLHRWVTAPRNPRVPPQSGVRLDLVTPKLLVTWVGPSMGSDIIQWIVPAERWTTRWTPITQWAWEELLFTYPDDDLSQDYLEGHIPTQVWYFYGDACNGHIELASNGEVLDLNINLHSTVTDQYTPRPDLYNRHRPPNHEILAQAGFTIMETQT